MAQFQMRVRRVIEEVFEFTMQADSDVHAHQIIEIPEKLERFNRHPVSRDVRKSVVGCHRVGD